MAKIVEEVVLIKFSKLVKDSDTDQTVVNDEVFASLEAVAQELAGNGAVVEVLKA
jgi:hypothetical protein